MSRKADVAQVDDQENICDFCGKNLQEDPYSTRRKYCSEACRARAGRGRGSVRLAMPLSKRYTTRLKFSNALYFS